ncbi:tripartite tricarboxylate transporter substrate binding protein [Pigmentiphaga sp. GD03639]|uniref:Tripartite tricarboxylate transporter substrate binding protein n=1 Tax=Pigmentiphaga daeguensis TaxID=414049 RepID=A0ABP3LSZ3_9BURK|nr:MULTISPECIES: tripartite tricarboxylate transporter substrate binding protein [unclassified Pigmentiphaga]MDH2238592.1 tripartite tricarboxylate transporter substrate binding protein [Pigmentiphaga sp. GD03639]
MHASRYLAAPVLGLLMLAAAPAQAQTAYPTRPIHLIVNGAPGSLPDLFARPIAEKMRTSLGQAVVIDNRPGAGGLLAMTNLKNSAADGYTLAVVTNAHAVWNQYLFSKLPYHPQADLQAVSPIAVIPMVLTASPALPAGSLKELVALAKARPGVLNYASSSTGSPPHVLFEMFKLQTGADILHVPFKSGPDALNSTISDRTQLYLAGSALIEPQVKDGRLKALAVNTRERLPGLPGVPTFAEQGYQGLEDTVWLGVVAQAGVPADIVQRLNREIAKAVRAEDMKKLYDAHGSVVYTSSPEEFAARIKADHALWGPVIRKANISLD